MSKNCQEKINQIYHSFITNQSALVALGDETRILILLSLLQSSLSGKRVGEIAQEIHLTRPSVSHHLKLLKEAGIVHVRKEKTMNFYYLSTEETQWKNLLDFTTQIYESIHSRCNYLKKEEVNE